jgi:hypothetical protein
MHKYLIELKLQTEDRVNIWNFTKQRENYLHHVQFKTKLNILHINQIIILTQKIRNINLINRTDCCFSVKSRTQIACWKCNTIYYGFSLLHIFSLVLQPWMSAYIRKTDRVYISVPKND